MKINVTQLDIDTGKPFSGAKCPIAIAIKRAVPTAHKINVGAVEISFWQGGRRRGFDTPNSAANFVRQFDQQNRVEPFEFEI